MGGMNSSGLSSDHDSHTQTCNLKDDQIAGHCHIESRYPAALEYILPATPSKDAASMLVTTDSDGRLLTPLIENYILLIQC